MAFSTLLAPVDFSEASRRSLEVATELAAPLGARLVVFHAVHLPMPGPPFPPGELTTDFERLTRYAEERAAEEMERMVADLPDGVRVETRIDVGDPVKAIVAAARDVGADLLVVGTHGRSGLSRLVLGSVAERVVRVAHCPVLTVRDGAPGDATEAD